MNPAIVISAVVVLLVLWLVFLYNSLVRKRNYIKEAWSSIDVQLKRKTNVLTNLVDTIKMQTKYESETLEKIIRLRADMTSGKRSEAMAANDVISRMLPSIAALSENYPELKSNQSYLHMMEDIKNVEDKIVYARTRYNMTVSNYNTAIQSFPASVFAGMLKFKEELIFEISDVEREYSDNLRIGEL